MQQDRQEIDEQDLLHNGLIKSSQPGAEYTAGPLSDAVNPLQHNASLLHSSQRRLRIGFLCSGDPESVLTWSGTPFHMLNALRQEFDIAFVVRHPWPKWAQITRQILRRLSKGKIDLSWVPMWTRLTAGRAISQIRNSVCDVVFAVAATPLCAEFVTEKRTVFVSDATFKRMVNYNPRFSSLTKRLQCAAERLEDKCIQNSVLCLFPSDWARRSALADHGGDSSRVVHVPWGANMTAGPIVLPENRPTSEWRLLFVGTNWEGKGGDIALHTVREMRLQGYSVHLDVVGSAPVATTETEGVVFHGFLNKRDASDKKRIEALFASAHAFFLPTQFEALGIVFAEAASYGLPSVSYATGGVPAMVENGITGILLEEGASPSAFARALIDLLSDRRRYVEMSYAALASSREQLNWKAWARRVRTELEMRIDPSQNQ